MKRVTPPAPLPHRRRGSLIPALGVSLLVLGAILAMVLNTVWLTNARQQLLATAEAAALAAAGTLVDDALLVPDHDPYELTTQARLSAEELAARNLANWTGTPSPGPIVIDVRFGRVVVSSLTGYVETLETEDSPNAVIVQATRDRAHSNPVALLLPAFMGESTADVAATAEASVTNLVAALRPFPQAPVAVWPLAVRETPLDGIPLPAWVPHVEQRQGEDLLAWDPVTRTVVEQPDGLPEIRVITRWNDKPGNLVQVTVAATDDETLVRQVRSGWSAADLSTYSGEFPVGPTNLDLPSTRTVPESVIAELEALLGQPRPLLLYGGDAGDEDAGTINFVRLVAARLMSVQQVGADLELILQPAVVTTRMATLDEDAFFRGETSGNPYIHKLSLTQ